LPTIPKTKRLSGIKLGCSSSVNSCELGMSLL
jgi:hypothetical protein